MTMREWLSGWAHWLGQLTVAVNQLGGELISAVSHSARVGCWADETISSRTWRMHVARRPIARITLPLIDRFVFRWQRVPPEYSGHCEWTYVRERERYQMPPIMRTEK